MTETHEADYLEPLRQQMTKVEGRITELETELAERRTQRTALGNALRGLDPQWAANHRPKKKQNRANPTGVGEERLSQLAELIRRDFPNEVFGTLAFAEASGIHRSTVNKVLNELRERGVIRLDHLGGQRKTTKFYRVVTADDA